MLTPDRINLFSSPEIQIEFLGYRYRVLDPYGRLGSGPIEFILKVNKEYIDLSETVLALNVRW